MSQDILEQLKSLKSIAPDADFSARTKRLVLAAPVTLPVWRGVFVRSRLAFAAVAMAVVALLVVFLPGAPRTVPIASAEALNNEFSNLSINIELQQISYNQSANQTISSALSEISGNTPDHLNPAVLQAEASSVDPNAPASNPEIEKLLNQVIQ